MTAESLEELLERTAEHYVRSAATSFLESERSFASVTRALRKSGFPKKAIARLLLPLRNHPDAYRAEALFNWLAKSDW